MRVCTRARLRLYSETATVHVRGELTVGMRYVLPSCVPFQLRKARASW